MRLMRSASMILVLRVLWNNPRFSHGKGKSLFKVFLESHKSLAGMGCKARCAVDSSAIHKRRNAANRPARHLPEGLE